MDDNSGCGCGCLSLIITFILAMFLVWLVFFGVSTPWGKYEIDVFPPAIKKVYPNFNH